MCVVACEESELEKGCVQTSQSSGEKKLIIAELRPPAVFGEMGCVGQCMYHGYAQTTEPSRIRTLSRSQLEAVLRQFPSITRRLLNVVSERFVRVLRDLEGTAFCQLIPRLAKLLLERAAVSCICGMTHLEMAEQLRVYRESATAALGELRMAGIIAVEQKQIRIFERARLERASREKSVSFTGIKSGGLRYTRQITHTIGAGIQSLSRPRRPPMACAGIDVMR